MFRKAIGIGLVIILVLMSLIIIEPVLGENTSNPLPPQSSPLFDMFFEDNNDTFELFTEQGITISVIVKNTNPAFTPISVTVSTDSDYCTSSNEQDTGTIQVDREVKVAFQFNWGRELNRGEEFQINFSGKITGDPIATSTESIVANIRSAADLNGAIISFTNDGSGKQGGEEVLFRTQVLNSGNIPATFMVKLFNGKNEVENRTKSIDVTGNEYFDILWVAKEGTHKFRVKLYVVIGYVGNNPSNGEILEYIADSDEVSLEISAGNILTEGVDNRIALVIFLVVILVVVVVAFLNRQKIKKLINSKRKK